MFLFTLFSYLVLFGTFVSAHAALLILVVPTSRNILFDAPRRLELTSCICHWKWPTVCIEI